MTSLTSPKRPLPHATDILEEALEGAAEGALQGITEGSLEAVVEGSFEGAVAGAIDGTVSYTIETLSVKETSTMQQTVDSAAAHNNGTTAPKKGWLHSLYAKALEHADSPKTFWIYLSIAFAESSFFLLPPDLLMIPMGVANRKLVWRLAFWGTVASVVGGCLGYLIGAVFMDTAGQWIINAYSLQNSASAFHDGYAKWGFWLIVAKGVTPIPYKIVTIASGMAHYPLLPFIGASVIARAFRFYLLATLLWFFGEHAKALLDKYLVWCLIGSVAIIVIGFVALKLLF
jgi:membrane protein YqaA with SNARE-associated domain